MQANTAKHTLFVLILTYTRPIEEVDRLLEAHRNYLTRYYEEGNFLTSGAQEPRVGGVILARAESKALIESVIANDPFLIAEVARYTIVEFHPTRAAAGLEPLLS